MEDKEYNNSKAEKDYEIISPVNASLSSNLFSTKCLTSKFFNPYFGKINILLGDSLKNRSTIISGFSNSKKSTTKSIYSSRLHKSKHLWSIS